MNKKQSTLLIIFLDFLAALVAWNIFYYLRKNILNEVDEAIKFVITSIPVAMFWVGLYFFMGFYQDSLRKSRIKESLVLLVASLLGTLILFFGILLDDQGVEAYQSYYKTSGTLFLVHFGVALFVKMIYLSVIKARIAKGELSFNTLIIGSNQNALDIIRDLKKINYSLGLNFVAYLHAFEDTKNLLKKSNIKHLGGLDVIEKVISRCNIEEVIVAVEPKETDIISGILHRINDEKLRVSIVPNLY